MGDQKTSLKSVLTSTISDIDIILRELVELAAVPKHQRTSAGVDNVKSLVQLLLTREKELSENLLLAEKQMKLQRAIDWLEQEKARRDQDIAKILTCLKESERMLITAIFQANQKLKSINQANARKVSVEDLIRYAHHISASNSVAAPLTWQQGDPERPFPTDVEMKAGWLNRLANMRDSQTTGGSLGGTPAMAVHATPNQHLMHSPDVPPPPYPGFGGSRGFPGTSPHNVSFTSPVHAGMGAAYGSPKPGNYGSMGSQPPTPTQPFGAPMPWSSPRSGVQQQAAYQGPTTGFSQPGFYPQSSPRVRQPSGLAGMTGPPSVGAMSSGVPTPLAGGGPAPASVKTDFSVSDSVEMLSSDSSSSSSSDSPA